MKFKEWLKINEAQRQPYQKSGGILNTAAGTGFASRFGHGLTQLPISASLDNTAVASVAGGIGGAFSKAMKKMGHEFTPAVRIDPYPREQAPNVQHGTLPLQSPFLEKKMIISPHFRMSNKSLRNLKSLIGISDPKTDPRIRKLGEDDSYDESRFTVFTGKSRDIFEISKEFTKALVCMIIIENMRAQYGENKYDLEKFKVEADHVDMDSDGKYKMVCVLSFQPKANSTEDLDGEE